MVYDVSQFITKRFNKLFGNYVVIAPPINKYFTNLFVDGTKDAVSLRNNGLLRSQQHSLNYTKEIFILSIYILNSIKYLLISILKSIIYTHLVTLVALVLSGLKVGIGLLWVVCLGFWEMNSAQDGYLGIVQSSVKRGRKGFFRVESSEGISLWQRERSCRKVIWNWQWSWVKGGGRLGIGGSLELGLVGYVNVGGFVPQKQSQS